MSPCKVLRPLLLGIKSMQNKIFTLKFTVAVFFLFIFGSFIGILNYNSVWFSSAENKDFKSKVIASLQASPQSSLSLDSLISGEWSEACIFVANTSYPESARKGLETLLEQRGLESIDDKRNYPLIFLFINKNSYKTIPMDQRYVKANSKTYVFYFKSEKSSDKHYGCVPFSNAILVIRDKEKISELLLAPN